MPNAARVVLRVAAVLLSLVAVGSGLAFLLGLAPPGGGNAPPSPEWHATHVAELQALPALSNPHVALGMAWVLLVPLQLSARLRNRHRWLHRAVGRIAMAGGVVMAVSGLWLGLVVPFAGRMESAIIALISITFLYALVRAFLAARAREIALHRRWVFRAVAIALSIATTRLFDAPLYFSHALSDQDAFCLAFLLGWTINVLVVEAVLRATAAQPTPASS